MIVRGRLIDRFLDVSNVHQRNLVERNLSQVITTKNN